MGNTMDAIQNASFRQASIPENTIAQGRSLGIWGDTHARMLRMVRRAAICSHPDGNRRFQNFIFQIHDGQVQKVHRIHE